NKGKAPLKMVNYPDYKIIGAITQVDKNIISGGAAASLSFRDADFGVSKDDMVSIISADMNIVNTANFEVLNGAGSSNSIAVYRQGLAGDLGGRIKSSGIFLNFSFDESEGMHQAIRTLLQLNTLEVLGKLAKVPFRKCLQSTYQQTDDEKEDRLEKAQTNSLVSVSVSTDPSFIRSKKSLDLEIISSKASFHLNGALNFKAKVSEDAHVHCFYQNYEGYIWKIFPNKQQASDYLIANKPVGIIEQNKAHEIALSMNNVTEQVMCLAAREELISALPLKEGALSVSSLTQVVSSYKQQNSKPLSQKVFSFQVK
ncbi:MAG: DUF4384 domain-containing protein, partial [Methylococcales bacterium]|nr:DUF4384 domain-containing protein [Methylococcales bacterium]